MVSNYQKQFNTWGGAHRAPSSDPSPRFFSSFALSMGFALNSQALCAFESGFVLDSRALHSVRVHPRFGLRPRFTDALDTAPQLYNEELGLAPKKFLDQFSIPPPMSNPPPSWGELDKTLIVYINIYYFIWLKNN